MRSITLSASTISRPKLVEGSSIVRAEYTPTILIQDPLGQVTYWNKSEVWYEEEKDATAVALHDLKDVVKAFEAATTLRSYTQRES